MRTREPWSDADISELRTMLAMGLSIRLAARRLQRSEEATRMCARKHGLSADGGGGQ